MSVSIPDTELELKRQYLALLKAKEQKLKYNYADAVFPDEGPYARDKYKKHIQFIKATKDHSFCLFGAGNQIGKTMSASYFIRTVATGKYPDWWEGRRWERPVSITIASVTPAQIRKAIQQKLFGRFSDLGTGMLSRDDLTDPISGELMKWNMPGTSNTIGTAEVNHVSGGKSVIEVLTYQQGRDVFQGNTSDIVLFDEEPDHYSLYSEAVRSILRNDGLFLLTFTPLKGITPLLMNFLPNKDRYFEGEHPEHRHRHITRAGILDVPHFSEAAIEAAKSEYEPHLLEARLYGIPCMGMGSVYPIKEEDIICAPFSIPDHWPRAYGMDFGWHNTAVAWIAQNPSTGVFYVYDEYKRGEQAAYVHANAIMARGKWIKGGCDPSGAKTEKDGSTYITDYQGLGLQIIPGNNAIATGTGKIYNLMESGLFKVFGTCSMWLAEFRSYQFDINNPNKIKDEQDDHELDATRYGISVFPYIAKSKDDIYEEEHEQFFSGSYRGDDEVLDDVTGY